MIITIDGPAGSGKSTAARTLATRLGIAFLDTGATYRAVTLKALRAGVDMDDAEAVLAVAQSADIRMTRTPTGVKVFLDGQDVSRDIRSPEVSDSAHYVANAPAIREVLVELQRKMGRELGDFVTEGRDQGSVVFPQANLKFYLDASPEVRARRRCEELLAAGHEAQYEQILAGIVQRDHRDSSRAVAPLVRPKGAIVIDTSHNTIEQTMEQLLAHVEKRS